MTWSSPWQSPLFVKGVELLRWLARRTPAGEGPLIRRLVATNNRRVDRWLRRHPPASVLLILPRCVRRDCCKVPDGGSLEACTSCTRCSLGALARIADRYGVPALVAFRSHVAFEMARSRRPDLIVATACEDRLVKALRSVPEVPAYLAPLTGMERMCVGAEFETAWFEDRLALCRLPRKDAARVASP